MPHALVVYFSRTGRTKRVAHAVAVALGADIEEIEEIHPKRRGFLGYMLSGYQAMKQRRAVIRPISLDPAAYDIVIIGTPIWAGRMSAPVRSYLTGISGKVAECAFFCTMGGSGGARAFRQMAGLSACEPLETMEVTEADMKGHKWTEKVAGFANRLKKRAPVAETAV